MNFSFLRSGTFWKAFLITLIAVSVFFAWELSLLPLVPGPVRMPPTPSNIIFTIGIIFLLSIDIGLYRWQKRYGRCPRGIRRATAFSWMFSGAALLCPVCSAGALALFGATISLSFLTPFIPLFHALSIFLLVVMLYVLLPR